MGSVRSAVPVLDRREVTVRFQNRCEADMGGGDKMATGSSTAAAVAADAPAAPEGVVAVPVPPFPWASEELRRACRLRRPVGVPDRPFTRCPIMTAPAVGDHSVTIFCKYKAWASSANSTAVKLSKDVHR